MLKPINKDIKYAETLDKSFYVDASFLHASKAKIFDKSWQFLIPNSILTVNNVIPVTLFKDYLNEPLVVTKSDDGILHCLPNVCNHRGNLLAYSACKSHNLRCKYHGRIFNLDGKFVSMPEFKEVANFTPENNHLKLLPIESWGPMLFTNLNNESSFKNYFEPIMKRMAWFPMDKLQFDAQSDRSFIIKANWALYCENYLEGFHVPFVHPKLNTILDFQQYPFERYELANLSVGYSKNPSDCFEFEPNHPEYKQSICAYYFWVFPNMMFNFYPWGLSLNIVEPIASDTCRVRFLSFILDDTKLNLGAGGDVVGVELEDQEIVQHVQQGLQSRFYQHGRYAPTRELGTHHFHELIYNYISN